MDLGVAIFPTDLSIRPDDLAREVEQRGFESLWVTEHTHLPVDHSPFPGGGELPDEYRRILDPFVGLGAAAAVTDTLKLGTGICLVPQRDALTLAKEVATIDLVSDGRFLFGVGYGWNRPETENHGTAFGDRREVLRERVLAMRELWTQEEAAYEGEHVSFAPTWSWPKPVQEGGPPVILGAGPGETTRSHLVEFCDGWLPIGAAGLDDEIPALHRALEDAGRDPAAFTVTVYGTTPKPDRIAYLQDLGVDRTVLWLPPAGRDRVLPALDAYTELLTLLR